MSSQNKFLLVSFLVAVATPVLAGESGLEAKPHLRDTTCDLSVCGGNLSVSYTNCQNLIVGIAGESTPGNYNFTFDPKGVEYVHGNKCPDANGGVNDWGTTCGQQSSSYGPNMRIPLQIVEKSSGTQVATITLKAQQNYCGLEAGDITFKVEGDDQGFSLVSHKSGGSWSKGKPGRICICEVIGPE